MPIEEKIMNKTIVIICTFVGALVGAGIYGGAAGLPGFLGGLVGGAISGAVAGIPVYMTVGAIRNVIQFMR